MRLLKSVIAGFRILISPVHDTQVRDELTAVSPEVIGLKKHNEIPCAQSICSQLLWDIAKSKKGWGRLGAQ